MWKELLVRVYGPDVGDGEMQESTAMVNYLVEHRYFYPYLDSNNRVMWMGTCEDWRRWDGVGFKSCGIPSEPGPSATGSESW